MLKRGLTDPFFRLAYFLGGIKAQYSDEHSSGVHLAVSGGLTAAVTIAASIRQQCSEEEAAQFHDQKVAVSYTRLVQSLCYTRYSDPRRFLLTVLGAYKQIRAQQIPVLSDIDEGNFDRAFDLIRPGTAPALPQVFKF
jgi:hypothetical protein